MKQAAGYYNALGYRVTIDGEDVYHAGNMESDSQGYVNAEDGVGVDAIRRFCKQTTREIAKERNAEYLGVEYEEPETD